MLDLPDPDWYLDNVLIHAFPGDHSRLASGPAAMWRAWWQLQDADLGAGGQGFVITAGQLRGAGLHDHDTRRAVRRGDLWRPARGVLSAVRIDDDDLWLVRRRQHALHAAAAVLRRPECVIGGRSAAILHGLPTTAVPRRAELTDHDARLGRHSGSHLYGARLTPDQTTTWFGAPITTLPRTLVDLARHNRRDGIMAVDAALAESLVDRDAVRLALDAAVGWPNVKQARAVLALGDSLAESPLESITRLALHDDDFPPPLLQVKIHDPRRVKPWRVDMLWPWARLVLECDGSGKYTDKEAVRERRREARLRALGFRVERVMWDEVVSDWPATSARLRRALAVIK